MVWLKCSGAFVVRFLEVDARLDGKVNEADKEQYGNKCTGVCTKITNPFDEILKLLIDCFLVLLYA